VARRLGLPLAPVFSVRSCPVPSPLYAVLMGYKESAVGEARRRFAPMVRTLFGEFLLAHGPCVTACAGGPIALVLPVPSSHRPNGSPLGRVEGLGAAACTPFPGAHWSPHLLDRAGAPVGHMRPAASAFRVSPRARAALTGRPIVLIDDTYVSGARAQSAAAALRRAGAGPTVIVALGRVLRPDRVALHAEFLRACTSEARRPPAPEGARCCRCVQTVAATE
jgi:hypothetical protein